VTTDGPPTGRRLARAKVTPAPVRAQPAQECVGLPFPIQRYRVLFSDGVTQDFLSYSDHSGVRGEMLDAHFGKRPKDSQARIEGIAHLGTEYVYTPHPTMGTVTVTGTQVEPEVKK